jgi:hypothetical protein
MQAPLQKGYRPPLEDVMPGPVLPAAGHPPAPFLEVFKVRRGGTAGMAGTSPAMTIDHAARLRTPGGDGP